MTKIKPAKNRETMPNENASVIVDAMLQDSKFTHLEEWSISRDPEFDQGVVGHGAVPISIIAELDRRFLVYYDDKVDMILGDEIKLTIENESSLHR